MHLRHGFALRLPSLIAFPLLLLAVVSCEIELAPPAADQPGAEGYDPKRWLDSFGLETRTFPLEHLATADAVELVGPYVYADRPGLPGKVSSAHFTRAISVRETPDNLDKIARMLEQFDVPTQTPSYQLHFQVAVGNGAESTDARLALVEKELRKVFRFDGYSLMGEGHVAVSQGSFALQIETDAPAPGDPEQAWRIHVVGEVFPGGELQLDITDHPRGWATSSRPKGRIRTRLGFRPGQTLVLGSMPSESRTVFVVVHVAAAAGEE